MSNINSRFTYLPLQNRYIRECTYTESFDDDVHKYTFTGTCHVTGSQHSVTVLGSELFAFNQTDRINEFKSLSPEDREFLISGTSPLGWQILYGTES